ncbi:FG-GAP-like repeat-containing protein [Luteolibacter flavescens]|uniref:FG-GAP-like repeat-containing protein n=1 Tax=Luteolibacter flavescens TaxID=1859460 RepID=A0ABT3FRM5_9BACT|nr:FG-GAP-like repeat-containing protein [Luteolibacter flavescens]MCW1886243.1 FG-GAP-like repeat-containing protein [Luteolibacter flavescens]
MKAALTWIALTALPASAQLTAEVREVARHPTSLSGCQVVDLDGDGDSDLLLSGAFNQLTVWCENRGDGSFVRPVAIEMKPRVFNWGLPHVADLHGTGAPDLLIRWSSTYARNLGEGNFAAPAPLPGTAWPTPTDPLDDLFTEHVTVFPGTAGKPDRMIVEKWDGIEQEHRQAFFYTLDEQGNPSVSPVLADGENLANHLGSLEVDNLFPTDIDGDGDIDLIYQYHYYTDPVSILRNRGDDTFDAREDIAAEDVLYSIELSKPVRLNLPGDDLPALVTVEHTEIGASGIVIHRQSESDGKVSFDPPEEIHRIPLDEDTYILSMTAIPMPEGDELWVRLWPTWDENESQTNGVLRRYRFITGSGWAADPDVTLPARGLGEVIPLTITEGNPGLACRLGSLPGVNTDSEEKIVWASLASLRTGTPEWQTIAGPFNDFSDFHLADLDRDGKLDMVSADRVNFGGAKSGRIHFVHDIAGSREHRAVDTESTDAFAGASPWPGNRSVIGDANGDLLPDLAVSSGSAGAIRLLENLGNRQFGPPATLAISANVLRPLWLGEDEHRFLDGSRIFTQAPHTGAIATLLTDIGTAADVVFTDMDGDGDEDVLAAPCPLGNVAGWGRRGASGNIESWKVLSSTLASPIRNSSGAAQLGWIETGPQAAFETVRMGVPGVTTHALPPMSQAEYLAMGLVGHPIDLDGDGDLDFLTLRQIAEEAVWGISPVPSHLLWHENLGNRWQFHPEPLMEISYPAAWLGLFVTQEVEHDGPTRVIVSNSAGEVFQIDFSAPIPGGTFGEWLASHDLTGASAGANADPDDDGLTNLEEALQGTSPVVATPGVFTIPVAASAPDGWTFSTALALDGSGIAVVAEASEDLEQWHEIPDEPEFTGDLVGRYHYRVTDEGMAGKAKRFVRFRFSGQP